MKSLESDQLPELTNDQLQRVTGGDFISSAIALAFALGYEETIYMFLHPFG